MCISDQADHWSAHWYMHRKSPNIVATATCLHRISPCKGLLVVARCKRPCKYGHRDTCAPRLRCSFRLDPSRVRPCPQHCMLTLRPAPSNAACDEPSLKRFLRSSASHLHASPFAFLLSLVQPSRRSLPLAPSVPVPVPAVPASADARVAAAAVPVPRLPPSAPVPRTPR